MTPTAFARALEQNRSRYNARFAAARRFSPHIDGQLFSEHLRKRVAPLVEAAEAALPGSAARVMDALFDISLDLFRYRMIGDVSRYPAILQGWEELMPDLGILLAQDPFKVSIAISNALYALSRHAGASPQKWIARMKNAAVHLVQLDNLLKAGQVAAWCCGMAHYRRQALGLLGGLPSKAGFAILGLPEGCTLTLNELVEELTANPWRSPRALLAGLSSQELQVHRFGAFSGFGGVFSAPPRLLAANEEAFVVRDGANDWLLYADCFGASFQRIETWQGSFKTRSSPFSIQPDGSVFAKGITLKLPALAGYSEALATPAALAVTSPWSHAVTLITLD